MTSHVISDEDHYCDKDALANVIGAKTVFGKLEGDELRTRSNPFDTIRRAFFLNRAAMKMVNLDAICQFMFSNHVDEMGNSLGKLSLGYKIFLQNYPALGNTNAFPFIILKL